MHAPPRIKDIERYWNDPPPAVTPRCMFWVRRITEQGWRTNRRVGSMDYYSKAEFFGVYIWEYLNVISPLI